MKRSAVLLLTLLAVAWAAPSAVLADKSSVTIEAPDTADPGTEVPVKLLVRHHGNNFLHHTEWVEVKVNGETVERWEFSTFGRPEEENFTREIVVKVEGPTEIVAEASCNIHGSAGPASKTIQPNP